MACVRCGAPWSPTQTRCICDDMSAAGRERRRVDAENALTSAERAVVESIRSIAAAGYYRADLAERIAQSNDHAIAMASARSCAEYPNDQDSRDRAFRRHLGA